MGCAVNAARHQLPAHRVRHDIAPEFIDVEQGRYRIRHHGVIIESLLCAYELQMLVEIVARNDRLGVAQLINEVLHLHVLGRAGRIKPRCGKQDVAFELEPLRRRERQIQSVARGTLRQERLWREAGLYRHLRPRMSLPVAEGIEDMMSGIALMAGEIQYLLGPEGETQIDLEDTVVMAQVRAEAGPGGPLHVSDTDALARRERNVSQRLTPAPIQSRRHHRRELLPRNDKAAAETDVALAQIAIPAQQSLQLGPNRGDPRAVQVALDLYSEESGGFGIKSYSFSCKNIHTPHERLQLREQILPASRIVAGSHHRSRLQAPRQFQRRCANLPKRLRMLMNSLDPPGRPNVIVDRVMISLAQCDREPHVLPGCGIEGGIARKRSLVAPSHTDRDRNGEGAAYESVAPRRDHRD